MIKDFAKILDEKIHKIQSSQPNSATNSLRDHRQELKSWELFLRCRHQTMTPQKAARGRDPARSNENRRLVAPPWLTLNAKLAASFFFQHEENPFWPTPSVKSLKKSYRRLAKRLHPDCHPNASPAEIETITEQFRKLHAAYLTLHEELHQRPEAGVVK